MAYSLEIKIKDFFIFFQIHRENRKSVSYSIRNDKVIIRLPNFMSQKKSQNYIDKAPEWVQKQLHKNPNLHYTLPIKPYPSDFQLLLCDQKVSIHIDRSRDQQKHTLILNGKYKASTPSFGSKWEEYTYIKKALSTLTKKVFGTALSQEVHFLQKKYSIKSFENLRFKYNSTNWGSCSSKNNINLNTRLCLLPKETRTYIILHEMAHLYHMNHSNAFWRCVETWCPDYPNQIAFLKKNAHKLDFYPYYTWEK
ncbi:M48 family metallopeptidase [Membranihabitans maritimus]|uniref:M48 family metallopeptidase n=1 Tax=Membranihabitans maritimus TaxID=2904244 RepID=UPI002106B1A5|nr:M48 family metallopeptidase [Membranihabitans maritimus]